MSIKALCEALNFLLPKVTRIKKFTFEKGKSLSNVFIIYLFFGVQIFEPTVTESNSRFITGRRFGLFLQFSPLTTYLNYGFCTLYRTATHRFGIS